MITITKKNLKEQVEALKKKHPNKKNPLNDSAACFHFFSNGKPSCIIGHALYNLGVEAKDFYSDLNNEKVIVQGLPGFCDESYKIFGKVKLTRAALDYGSNIQEISDGNDGVVPIKWKYIE